jgi:ADP-ribose pyrophosphatase
VSRWKILESTELLKKAFFRLRQDRCELPDGRVMPAYYVFEFTDWVNVIPVTSAGQVLAITQYRHASEQVHLEIPGGSMDPPSKENPEHAASRELLEETGYSSSRWISCGFHYPNPALQNNRMHTFVALDCELTAATSLDPFEDLTLTPFPVGQLSGRLEAGEFSHSIIAASVARALPVLRREGLIG